MQRKGLITLVKLPTSRLGSLCYHIAGNRYFDLATNVCII